MRLGWKRLAQVLEADNGGQGQQCQRPGLARGAAGLPPGRGPGPDDGQAGAGPDADLFNAASNRMALELALRAANRSWAGFERTARARLQQQLEARHRLQPDFWSHAALVDLALYDALASRQLAARVDDLAAGYGALQQRVQAPDRWQRVADQLRFVLAPPRAPVGAVARAAAARLLQLVDGFARGPAVSPAAPP